MTRHDAPAVGIREIARWWPLLIISVLIAAGASVWSVHRQETSYTATTKLVVVPLAQWDEIFLGTTLIRDAGDIKITAATTAAQLDTRRAAEAAADYMGAPWTPESIDAAVKVSAAEDTNVINVVARSVESREATELAEGFAHAILADRWRTIANELDARIAAISATTANDPNAGEASQRLQTLTVIRESGYDPTLRIDSTGPTVRNEPMPVRLAVGLAAVGGLFVGMLAALGMVRLRRRPSPIAAESLPAPAPVPAPDAET